MKNIRFVLWVAIFALVLPALSQTPVDEASRGKIMDAIMAKYQGFASLEAKDRNARTAAFMKTFKEIIDAGMSDDGNVWAIFADGMPYEIFANMAPLPEVTSEPPPLKKPPSAGPHDSFPRPYGTRPFPGRGPSLEGDGATGGQSVTLKRCDLPVSTRARVATALGNAFRDCTGDVRRILEGIGYRVAPGNDASIETLMALKNEANGVFFMEAHGGNGMIYDWKKGQKVLEYILTTSSLWSETQSKKYADMNLFIAGKIGACEATFDRDPKTKKAAYKRFFTISSRFIREYWRFSDNSFVGIHACTSMSLRELLTSSVVNASFFVGYNVISNDHALESLMFLIDRLAGANEFPPREDYAPQRPFDYASILADMGPGRKRLNPVPKDPKITIEFAEGPGKFGLLAPSITFVDVLPYRSRVELAGMFGADPGEKNRSVTIDAVAVPVESWEQEKIVCHLPSSEKGSCGEVVVTSRSRPSNSRWLTQWKGMVNISETGEGSLHFAADFTLRLVADPWSFRENAGDRPRDRMLWGVSSMSGSKCFWSAAGEVLYNGRVNKKWTGKGAPSVVLDDEIFPLGATFEAGGIYDIYQKSIWIAFAILDTFTVYPALGSDPSGKAPVRMGAYTDSQTAVRMKVDSDFNILEGRADIEDEPDKFAYGGKNGVVSWPNMTATHRMPKDRKR